jgi:hypothetical protein
MNRLFRSIAITLFLPIIVLPLRSLANDKIVKVQFFCGRINQDGKIIPTTQAMTSEASEALSLIVWKYPPPKGMSTQQRCEIVSQRFQSAWNVNTFDKLIPGKDEKSGLGLICAVSYRENKCDRSNLLFTLNSSSDAEDIIDRLRNTLSGPGKSIPVPQDSGSKSIDMQLLIDRLKNNKSI